MDIHEYQAKAILGRYGIPFPPSELVESADAARAVAARLDAHRFAVKAQVLAGARGKAGGVRLVASAEDAADAARSLLGNVLVTEQTGSRGRTVRRVLIEEAVDHSRALFLALMVDREAGRIVLLGARDGGEDIEERAARDPRLIIRLHAHPVDGLGSAQLASFTRALALEGELADRAAAICRALYDAFVALDATLIEINPLVVTPERTLLALDAKLSFDDNALFRHGELAALRDPQESDPVELEAQRYEMNYVRLNGDIGVIVNGAGLALATLDLLVERGGAPANFMDIRPEATSRQIAAGLGLVLGNRDVKTVLVNIYGGGLLRCDTVAEGLALAMKKVGRNLPIIMRAAGTNAELSLARLNNYGIAFRAAADMGEAIDMAVAAAREADG